MGRERGVDDVSSTDAWAAGRYLVGEEQLPFVEHWDGQSWTQVESPSGGSRATSALESVSFDAADDRPAVGGTTTSARQTSFALHWDGLSWSRR